MTARPGNPSIGLRLRLLTRLLAAAVALTASLAVVSVSGCMESMFYIPQKGPTPAPRAFVGSERVTFTSADGTRLVGWFIPSQHHANPPATAATILHVHGNAGNITSHIGFTDYLPAAGFNLFLFDYRGYGESDGSALRRDDLMADTHAALDCLLARDDIDHGRIGMYGQSLGGAIGLNVMHERGAIRAAVLESTFTSWRAVAANAVGGDTPGPVARTLARLLIRDGRRPIDAIAEIDRPLLLLHGTADSIVPIAHSRELAAAATSRSRLIEFAGAEHNAMRWTEPEMPNLVVEFLRASLSPGAAEPANGD